ncbi:hypothetical protein PR048_025099 [Dryococelus australis]|uniref:DDE Tnp4 domain-containing protein n=1 Tax=Dryococelus australis TaxID=614101 RepID=A0ABQ9GQH1_9NEOP|nr:hypothetical protein PR048_025099 [Dryococelus australis]
MSQLVSYITTKSVVVIFRSCIHQAFPECTDDVIHCTYKRQRILYTIRTSSVIGRSLRLRTRFCRCVHCGRICVKIILKIPKSQEDWKHIAREFEEKFYFPHCLGGVDGKHVRITPPPASGSYYYNYNGVLMATANANHEFIICELGVFLGDVAFALTPTVLEPFHQQQLTNERFRIFHTSINLKPASIDNIAMTCCELHNFLRRNYYIHYTPAEVSILRRYQAHFHWVYRGHYRSVSHDGKLTRQEFVQYFNNEGTVPWQNAMCEINNA